MDAQTSLPERRAVEAHLGECDLCRAELADLRALKGLLAQLPRREPPRAFVLGPRAVRPAALSGTFSGFVRATTSIAAALAFLAVGMSLFLQGLPRQSVSTAASSLATSSATAPSPLAAAAPAKAAAPAGTAAPVVASPSSGAPAAARPAAAAKPAAQAPLPPGAAASPATSAGLQAQPAAPAVAGSPVAPADAAGPQASPVGTGAAAAGPPADKPAAAAPGVSGDAQGRRVGSAAPAPVNVPRLAGELVLLLTGLGLAVYSLKWWRA